MEGGVLVLALLLARPLGVPLRTLWSGGIPEVALGVAAAMPMMAGFMLLLHWDLAPLRELRGMIRDRFVPLFRSCRVIDLVVLSALAGIGEEALFRGVLQTGLAPWLTPWGAIAVATMLFAAAHWVNATYAALAGIFGLYLGVLFHFTGDLSSVTIAHGLYDLMALLYLVNDPGRHIS